MIVGTKCMCILRFWIRLYMQTVRYSCIYTRDGETMEV
jgi:hypothetical protein